MLTLKTKNSVVINKNFVTITKRYNSKRATTRTKEIPNVVIVDAVRTPFLVSNTQFKDLMAVDLQRHALKALIDRTQVDPKDVGHISCGQVIQECRTSNVAREAAILSGLPKNIPCSSVVLGCISSNLSIYQIASMIESTQIDAGIAGGAELLSDFPIRYNRQVRAAIIQL